MLGKLLSKQFLQRYWTILSKYEGIYYYYYKYLDCDFRCNNCDGPTHKDCESCSNRDKVVEDSVDKSCNCKVGTSPIYYSHLNTYYCAGNIN